jgi:hypothetical protein
MPDEARRRARRAAAVGAIVLAGLASLATSEGPPVLTGQSAGSALLSQAGAAFQTHLSIKLGHAQQLQQIELQMSSQGSIGLATAAAPPTLPLEARFTVADGQPTQWLPLPATTRLPPAGCGSSPGCAFDVRIDVRPTHDFGSEVTFRWQVDAYVTESESDAAGSVSVTTTTSAPTAAPIDDHIRSGLTLGSAIALALLLTAYLVRRRVPWFLEFAGGTIIAGLGLLLTLGGAEHRLPLYAGLVAVLGFLVVFSNVLRENRPQAPRFVAVLAAILLPNVVLSVFATPALYTDTDVVAASACTAIGVIVGVVALIAALRALFGELDLTSPRLWVTVATAATLGVAALVMAIAQGLALTISTTFSAFIFVCVAAVTWIACWVWLNRRSGPPDDTVVLGIVAGLSIAGLTLVAYAADLIFALSQGPGPEQLSMAVTLLAGVVLGVLLGAPPKLRSPEVARV